MASTLSSDVIVIGAGPGGLAAAMLLAASGLQVRVIERREQVGGRTSSIRAGGFRFDTGATFFLYPRVLEEIFAASGADLHRELDLRRLDPHYRLVFGSGGELLATSDQARMAEEIGRMSPADAGGLARFLADSRVKMERFRPCIERPFLHWRDVFSWATLRLLPLLKPWRSLDREMAAYFSDPRVRLAFTFQSKYLGMSPFRCPSLFSILSFLEYEYGVYHPIGGCGEVSEAMARVARRLGVQFSVGEPVEELLFEGRQAVGVRTARSAYRARAVVINADFARAMRRLVPDHLRRRWTNGRIARKKFSCSTFMLYLGIEGIYDELPHHNVYISGDYRRNLDEVERLHVLSDDPSFYVQNACVTDPTLAPSGMSTVYVLVPVTHCHDNVDWTRERERYRALVFQRLARVGMSGVAARVRWEKVVTPMDWDSGHEIHLGATFNLSHSYSQLLHLRPRNRFEDLGGVYLVGGGTHPGSGLPVIFESARITSRLLLDDIRAGSGSPGGRREKKPSRALVRARGP